MNLNLVTVEPVADGVFSEAVLVPVLDVFLLLSPDLQEGED